MPWRVLILQRCSAAARLRRARFTDKDTQAGG
jgi:hypothetical protein